jgi:hypothetical protein
MMNSLKSLFAVCLVASVLLLALPGDASAYVDPGTGSYVLQIVIAGLVSIAFTLKIFWGRFTGFFQHGILKKKDAPDDIPGEDE